MAIKVLVTGAAGQIGYSLVPLIARGDVFGNQPVHLVLLDIPNMMGVLKGVVMELEDCAYPLLEQVSAYDNVDEAFKDLDYAFLVGAMPRREGMERRDLLKANVKIFREQGEALEKHAKRTVKVLVVGNPANTNAFICMKHAQSIPKENFSAMTRLDQNRAAAQIAAKAGVGVKDIRNVIIWGNHSSTQFPDARMAEINQNGQWSPVTKKIQDAQFLQSDLIQSVQKRGAAVIAARKLSSAMSAAKAAADHMHDWVQGTKEGVMVSMAVPSTGAYKIPQDLMYSFPVKCSGGKWEIVEGLEIGDFERERMSITQEELEQERDEALATVQG